MVIRGSTIYLARFKGIKEATIEDNSIILYLKSISELVTHDPMQIQDFLFIPELLSGTMPRNPQFELANPWWPHCQLIADD